MKRPAYKYLLGLLDWVTMICAFLVALKLHGLPLQSQVLAEFPYIQPSVLVFVVYAVFIVLILEYNNLYKINVFLTVADQGVRLLQAIIYSVLGLGIISFFTRSPLVEGNRLVIFYLMVVAFLMMFFMRAIVFRNMFLFLARNLIIRERILIIGTGQTARLLAADLRLKNPFGMEVVGFIDDEVAQGTAVILGKRVLGSVAEIVSVVDEHSIDEIVVCSEGVSHERLLRILDISHTSKARVKIASSIYGVVPERIFTERYGDIPVVGITSLDANFSQRLFKRAFDVILASLGVLFLSPIFIVLAALIRLDSRGPILYKQMRIGKNGIPFKFYKFRSMYIGADKDVKRMKMVEKYIHGADPKSLDGNNGTTKIVDKSKITPIGRFIRRTSLDELPQLFNVIIGDMSLVGPRPCLPYEWEHYADWHKRRLSITPGCTGVWQVSGRSEVGFDNMVILDLYYIQNRSLFLDILIILKTIPVMIFGRGGE